MPLRVRLDPAAAYPEIATVRKAVRSRDWPAVQAVLRAASPGMRTAALVEGGGWLPERGRAEPFLREVLAADPADSAAAVMLAGVITRIAWRHRTARPATHVSRERFRRFRESLQVAESLLQHAAHHRPRDPAIWTASLSVARGLQLGQDEIRRRYTTLAEIDPHHIPGQQQVLRAMLPRWGGSWPAAHAFALNAAKGAPAGGPQGALVAEYHIQYGTFGERVLLGRYLRREPVREELAEAAAPGFDRQYGWDYAANSFAMAFSFMGDRAAAGEMFALLGNRATMLPWSNHGDPGMAIRYHRLRAKRPRR